jgi:hypothetical protein
MEDKKVRYITCIKYTLLNYAKRNDLLPLSYEKCNSNFSRTD